jgi:hypothetical protein
MTALRFFLIILIYVGTACAWAILGGTIEWRTHDRDVALSEEVTARWGPSGLVQTAPGITSGGAGDPARSEIKVHFDHENRYMGLVWFSTYTVSFSGTYTVAPQAATGGADQFVFELPPGARAFENLGVTLDGQEQNIAAAKNGNRLCVQVPADVKEHIVTVAYRTQGRDRWIYDLARGREVKAAPPPRGRGEEASAADPGQAAMVKALSLVATTNFREIDYPKGCVSPTPHKAEAADGGMKAEWHFENRSTRERIGIEMPSRENAGPIAARMSFHAPVSLFFFFTVMFTIVILKKIPLHPMHYLFISAGFFSFHILMAYLVDHVDIHQAFWICAIVSVFLVVSYMRLVAGVKFAVVYAGLAQLVYLIGFSYAFFFTGWTGLTVVIVAIVTLFVLMQTTGRLNWNEVFAAKPALPRPSTAAPVPPTTPPPRPTA